MADEQRVIDLYHRNGLIPKQVEAASVFDTSFNAAAQSGAESATQ